MAHDPHPLNGPLDPHREMRRQFARLWQQAEPHVQAFVFSMVPSFHDAEDLVQKLAEEVAVRFDEYDAARPFEAWVIWIARHRVIDHFRRARRDRHVFDESLIDAIAEAQVERARSVDPRAEALERCVERLPIKSRSLLDLRYVQNETPAAIADRLGSTAGSIRVQLHRVRESLAECIGKMTAGEAGR
jgi:RNA polymerase sigma-70 factor (ECF subfamily)